MANWKDNLDKLRRWIDSDAQDKVEENIISAHENKSESELFLHKLLKSVEVVLKAEIIRIPNTNKAYAPEKFLVFISEEADKSLRDDKRRFFEQSLTALIMERAKELAGRLELTAKKIGVEILVNATLENDEVEVKIGSENKEIRDKTIQFVLNEEKFKLDKTVDLTGIDNDKTEYVAKNDLPKKDPIIDLTNKNNQTIDDLGTVDDLDSFVGILYRVEIWQDAKKINEVPIVKRQVTIGRDDTDKVANLRLPTDNRKISRTHAEIRLEENGELWVTANHKNPTIVSGKAIRNGEWEKLGEDGEIQVYDFTLKIKFTK
ncbi:MAG TPA: FHA domain-containing protein [Pyrinomonadaceae bacterium]|nr:FHA domain-containing protein [Pyrinomonadaceae bacterium]